LIFGVKIKLWSHHKIGFIFWLRRLRVVFVWFWNPMKVIKLRYLNLKKVWFELWNKPKEANFFFSSISLIISTRIGSYYFWFISMELRFFGHFRWWQCCIIPIYFRCSICALFRKSMSYKSIFKLDGDNDETTSSVIFLRRRIDTEFIFISEFSSSQKPTLDVEDLSEDQINNSGDEWRIHFVWYVLPSNWYESRYAIGA